MKAFKEKRAIQRNLARTIVILPSSPEKKVLTFSPPPLFWILSCVVVLAVPILAGFGFWGLYRSSSVNARAQHLEIENQTFRSALAEQKERVHHLSHELLTIREKAGFIKDFLGMESDSSHKGGIGQGGVELSPKGFEPPSNLAASGRDAGSDRSRSILRAMDIQQIDTDLERIIGILQDRKERLDSMPSITPVDPGRVWLSSAFGMRTSPFTGKRQFHPGVDLAGAKGTPILAPAKGRVAFVGNNGSLGLSIEIRHDSTYKTTYAHLSKGAVKKGQRVERGEVIGYMGDTGRTTGYHLHYEVEKDGKRVNPVDYMMDWGQEDILLAVE